MGPGLSDSAPPEPPYLGTVCIQPSAPRHEAGRGGQPSCSLLRTPHPGSHAETRPVPVPSQVSGAQLALRLLEAARALLISLSTGVGSAASTGPIKHRLWPLQHTARPGKLSLPGPGRTSFFFKELISQTHKIATNANGVCALKDNYRVTPRHWRLVGGTHSQPEAPS